MTQDLFSEPPSVDAHRRLVRAALAAHLEVPTPTGEYPHGGLHFLWQEAVRVQMSILGGWEVEAREAVERLVQHALRLASMASWFLTDYERREIAVEETIIHNAYGWTVTSQEAQEAWRAVWSAKRQRLQDVFTAVFDPESGQSWNLSELHSSFEDSAEERMRPNSSGQLEAAWLEAWERWATTSSR